MLAFLVSSGFSNKDIYNLVKNKVIEKKYKTACILTNSAPKERRCILGKSNAGIFRRDGVGGFFCRLG